MQINIYYQIDYLGDKGALYIDTGHDLDTMVSKLNVLNNASRCITGKNLFVLDLYAYIADDDGDTIDDTDECILQDVTHLYHEV